MFHLYEFRHDGTDYLGSTTAFRIGDDLDDSRSIPKVDEGDASMVASTGDPGGRQ